ncbi:MAG: transcription antitermination factor NusB [Bacteroidales bacterium]|nr:transcription antitermination factor NusB [Bacteroidales bacterium]MCB9012861.1 transcription antitermination factor NusB [Bacteroidales bacterium]
MISRRLLRIKALQVLYAYYATEQKDLSVSEKELHFSINKSYELYNYLLLLIQDIIQYAESRIEIAANKRIPSFEDLHPNKRFVSNKLAAQLAENIQLSKYISNHHISWVKYPELIKELYLEITEFEDYKQYMEQEESSYAEDKKLLAKIYSDIILTSESFNQVLEEQSIYWNDDLEYVIAMVLKTIKKFNEEDGPDKKLLDLYKNKEDHDFVIDLFRKSIAKRKDCLELIESTASNWDLERIAFMDILIMQLAITELLEFPSIPTKVSLNEYLEIAKYYSTEKSNNFINGVLDKIMALLKEKKMINKSGRGLIGEL